MTMSKKVRIKFATLVISLIINIPIIYAGDCNRAARLVDEVRQNEDITLPAAERTLREAVFLCENSASLHYNLGGALYSSGKLGQAQTEFEEALRLKPSYAKAMSSLATVLYLKKEQEYDRALQLARQAKELEPNNRRIREAVEQIEASVDAPIVTKASNANAVAVVIGNRKYNDTRIPEVEFADHDADVVKNYLVDSLGFREKNIIFLKNAKYTDLLTVFGDSHDYKGRLYNFTKQGKADIFIFYSGHGAPDTNTKKAYLAPVDINPDSIKHTSYPLDQLYENLAKLSKEKQARSVTIVLDACFSGGQIIRNASPIYLEVSQPVMNIKNGAIITSSKGDQISSWYPEQKHGLFTYHFLKAVRDILTSGKTLTVAGIEQKLLGSDGVNEAALRLHSREQVPQVSGKKDIALVKAK